EASQDAILLRNVSTNGESGAFLAAQDDASFFYIFADVLEAHRRFEEFSVVELRNTIDQMGRRDRPGDAALPAAAFNQVIHEHGNQLVGIDEFRAFIQYAEAVGITVGCQSQLEPILLHHDFQFA